MGRLGRPYPLAWVVDLAAFGAHGAPVEHLISGVLRIAQDVAHATFGPRAARSGLAGRDWWRVLGGVGVEPLGDEVVAEAFVVAPVRDQRDGLGTDTVGCQAALRVSLRGFRRIGMRQHLCLVAVGRHPDVPALADVRAQAAPGLFEGVEDLVLGDGLVDPALKDALRVAPGDADRLVRGEQRHVGPLEFPLHRQSLEREPRDAGDAFADDHVETPVRAARLG